MVVIIKETKNHYKVTAANVRLLLQAKILQDTGDTVIVTGFYQDPTDATFFIIETA